MFKALFIGHAPDAVKNIHRSIIDTGLYRLYSVIVKTQEEAIEVSKELYEEEKIDAVILCPGFTHSDVAEIFQSLEGKVSINVARGDGPSGRISKLARGRAYHK